jgi:uncharacterized membrane protein
MRTFIVLVIMAGLGVAFVVQKRSETPTAPAAQKVAATQTAAAPRPVSEHNWAKHSLDTTNKVIREVAQQRKADGSK